MEQSSITEITKGKTATSQVALSPVNISQVNVNPLGDVADSTTGFKLDSVQSSSAQVSMQPIESREISFAVPIPSEQFFSLHNSTPQIISAILQVLEFDTTHKIHYITNLDKT
ncbi:MAG: hypothetical protein ACRC2R_04025 [Xenococcaceae cyanobacterium]